MRPVMAAVDFKKLFETQNDKAILALFKKELPKLLGGEVEISLNKKYVFLKSIIAGKGNSDHEAIVVEFKDDEKYFELRWSSKSESENDYHWNYKRFVAVHVDVGPDVNKSLVNFLNAAKKWDHKALSLQGGGKATTAAAVPRDLMIETLQEAAADDNGWVEFDNEWHYHLNWLESLSDSKIKAKYRDLMEMSMKEKVKAAAAKTVRVDLRGIEEANDEHSATTYYGGEFQVGTQKLYATGNDRGDGYHGLLHKAICQELNKDPEVSKIFHGSEGGICALLMDAIDEQDLILYSGGVYDIHYDVATDKVVIDEISDAEPELPSKAQAEYWLKALGIEHKMVDGKPQVKVSDIERIKKIFEGE